MIEGYAGLPGSGKSYTMTARALAEMKRGHPVYANYHIDGAEMFDPSEDLLYLPPGFIVLDEAHLSLSSRQFHKLPHSWMVKLSQTRKAGWHLLWCAQNPMRIDKALRDLTNVIWWCHCWPNSMKSDVRPRIMWANCYEPIDAMDRDPRNAEVMLQRSISRFSIKVARSYDTFATLAGARHLDAEEYDEERAQRWERVAQERAARIAAERDAAMGPVMRAVVGKLRRGEA